MRSRRTAPSAPMPRPWAITSRPSYSSKPSTRKACAVTGRGRAERKIVFEPAMGPDVELLENCVVSLDGLDRRDHAVDNEPQELHEGELVFRVVDLASIKRDPGTIPLGVGEE